MVGRSVLSDRNKDGLSSACFATLCGRDQTLAVIADIDASVFLETDDNNRSTVHHAAAEGSVPCLRILADGSKKATGATAAARGRDGATVTASSPSDNSSVAAIASDLSEGGSGESEAKTTNVAAAAAAVVTGWLKGRPRTHHPFANCIDTDGQSPLHIAARAGHVNAFVYLVTEAGLNPEDLNARGETCLWLAAAHDRVREYC